VIARLLVGLCFIASPVSAQILWDQANVPSVAVAQGYAYKLYITAPGATTPTTLTLTAVTCVAATTPAPFTANCQAPTAQAPAAIAPGASSQLTATDSVNGSAESTKSLPFVMAGCPDPTNVKVVVGTWARTLPVGGVGQVLFSLLQSKTNVTTISVQFNGVEQGRVDGARLNTIAGSYFTATVPAGTYQLTVQATDAAGCTDGGAARPMTVVVQ
jgi:hypothetical protein